MGGSSPRPPARRRHRGCSASWPAPRGTPTPSATTCAPIVLERLGAPRHGAGRDADGVLILDETGFLKKGEKSAGVQCQYFGTAGRIEYCQVGVFRAQAGRREYAFIDREPYLPTEWCDQRTSCREAGIPDGVPFRTKPELARRMLARALDAGVAAAWVTGDEVCGGERRLRLMLEERGQPFVLAVQCSEPLWHFGMPGRPQPRADAIAAALPAAA